VDIVHRLQQACREIRREPGLSHRSLLEINVTLSNFVPKPHTPFQWFPQDTMEQLYHKIEYLKEKFKPFRGVKLNFTDPEISKLEAVISRSGPELADVVELAYRKGAYLDAWEDLHNFGRWFEALEEKGIHYEAYTRDRCCDPEEVLPWDVVDVGLTKAWLKAEYMKATEAASTTPCFETCSVCGVCGSYSTWPKFIETPTVQNVRRIENSLPEAVVEADLPSAKKDPVCKVRLTLEKRGDLRFISHLDWLRMIYRAVSRAKLPMAYSRGFNPRPKIAFSPALPLFTEAWREYVDLELTESVEGVAQRLNLFLPPMGKALDEQLIPLRTRAIDGSIVRLSYRANYSGNTTCAEGTKQVNMTERLAFLKSQTTLPVEVESRQKAGKRGHREPQTSKKVLDLVPYLENLSVDGDDVITFTIRRLPLVSQNRVSPTSAEPKSAEGEDKVSPGSYEHDSQNLPESTVDSAENAAVSGSQECGLVFVKPSWVLDLINPTVKWSLTRTGMEMAP